MRLIDLGIDMAFDAFTGRSEDERGEVNGSVSTTNVDAHALASDLYGPDVLEKRKNSAVSIEHYVKAVMEKVALKYIGGDGAFKKFLFQCIDLMPFLVSQEYEQKVQELEKKYKNAQTKEEARLVKREMKKVRKRLMGGQLVQYCSRELARTESGPEVHSLLKLVMSKRFMDVKRLNPQGEGEVTHLVFRGVCGDEVVFVPPISVRCPDGQKRPLRSVIAEATSIFRFKWGYPVTAEVLLHSREATEEDFEDLGEAPRETSNQETKEKVIA